MTLLLLSGTSEAREIGAQLHAQGTALIASLAGATRSPRAQGVDTRIGGFGGADGFRAFLKEKKISAVLDATHPFAKDISHRSARICAELRLPYALYLRPAWEPSAADNWVMLGSETEAAAHIKDGSVVFLATGRNTLERFANLATCRLICRQIDPPDGPFPFPNGEFLVGRPPFSIEDEIALFRKLKVDWLIVKNAGGQASFSKLEAARSLGLKVGMIARPTLPQGVQMFEHIDEAVAWGQAHA